MSLGHMALKLLKINSTLNRRLFFFLKYYFNIKEALNSYREMYVLIVQCSYNMGMDW